jgi:hypothetical protein
MRRYENRFGRYSSARRWRDDAHGYIVENRPNVLTAMTLTTGCQP